VQPEGTPLFQAAGWIEPRPTPITAGALTEGVVEQLLVVAGQAVEAGVPIARLIDVDAKLALREAKAQLDLRHAELESAEVHLTAARLKADQPVHLEVELADAKSQLAKIESSLAQLPYLVKSAEAREQYARQNLEGKQSTGGATSVRAVQQATSELAIAEAEAAELRQRKTLLEQEAAALRSKVDALSTRLTLLVDESRDVQDATAKQRAALARVDAATVTVEKAQLALDRTIVRAPITGRVLSVVAQPGMRVMGLESVAHQSSSTVATLYDPKMLQVRADVRLEDVPRVETSQRVEIRTASSQETILGTVLTPTSQANIQKNTLEVKVAIDDPPATIRPEMLVTATFMASPRPPSQAVDSLARQRLLIPRQLVHESDGAPFVWIVDTERTASRASVSLGRALAGELVEVLDGLKPTDKIIASGHESLSPGRRVTITGEDQTIGLRN
jgi:RND family efflux transporter MFP subunit